MLKNIKNLAYLHILIIASSNVLVQYPFVALGFRTTWGALIYPLVFIITDLTVRILGAHQARAVIFKAMFPGLFLSYFLSVLFSSGTVLSFDLLALRISLACFIAYVVGQLLDILVFQKFRASSKWWLAPLFSLIVGNFIDTFIFFFLAFYKCHDPILSVYWPEIAFVDSSFKLIISTICFLPIYGMILNSVVLKQGYGVKN